MDKLIKILTKKVDERSEKEVKYLVDHAEELTVEQKTQLENEGNEVVEEIVFKGEDKLLDVNKDVDAKVIYKEFSVEVKEVGDHLQAIVNSGLEDRHGEILDMKGLDIKRYMTNPVLAYSHDYEKMSVGRTDKITKTRDGQLVADFKFATDIDGYDTPKILDQLYRKKYQFAFSIGFIPGEMKGNTYTRSEMIEFSPVLIGADARALLKKLEVEKKVLDKTIIRKYTKDNMNLEELLAKEIKSLTIGEIKFLKENVDNMTPTQVEGLKSVLEEKKEVAPNAEVEAKLKELQSQIEEMKANEKTIVKNIAPQYDVKKFQDAEGNVSPQMKFLLYAQGLQNKDFSKYREVVGKDMMNTSGDGVVLPPQEFVTEIIRLEAEVGVARKYATVRKMASGAGIKYLLGADDVEIFDTAESGVKQSTKLSYNYQTLLWRKFAGILPITDELTEDSAIDLWNDATQRFARAYTVREDQLVFTETAVGGATKDGILNVSGTKIVPVASLAAITYDDFVDMILGVPSMSAANGKFWLNREMLGVAMKLKDEDNRPLWLAGVSGGTPATILGKPYIEVEVMPNKIQAESGDGIIAFGDLKYSTLAERTDLNIKIFDTGSVGDPDEIDQEASQINLLTQDGQAMRCVKRMNAICRFPAAFSVMQLESGS